MNVLAAHDWIVHARNVESQLSAALENKKTIPGKRERRWLADAVDLLRTFREETGELFEAALQLPELEVARSEAAAAHIEPWADAVERLLAGITFHMGPRAPILEVLFPHKKIQALRKAKLHAARAFAQDLERRLTSAYVVRLLETKELEFAVPVAQEVRERTASLSAPEVEPASEEEQESVRQKFGALASEAEQRVRQARLLAEAATLPVEGLFQTLAIAAKPKKRSAPKPEVVADTATPSADVPTKENAEDVPAKKKTAKKTGTSKKSTPKKATTRKTTAKKAPNDAAPTKTSAKAKPAKQKAAKNRPSKRKAAETTASP